ncbi:MAG TPA: Wzz/FepE/Etk N-terminal domain-containing protein [Spirochaetota bacterium]|nr:Wzz/FepE/Etk N-terminal domain-containing protein [Spirochaetota bacterium]HPR47789.1 Wzz/FepE/Etk N-terminal domain-containing protein [Spirochaetota bacterium]
MYKNIKVNEYLLRDILSALFRKKHIVPICVLIILIVTYIILEFQTPIYEASVKMLVRGQGQIQSTYYEEIIGPAMYLSHIEMVKSNPVMELAVKTLNLHKRPLDYEKEYASILKWPLINFIAARTRQTYETIQDDKKEDFLIEHTVNSLKNDIYCMLIPYTNIFAIYVTAFDPDDALSIANVISRSYSIFDQQQQLAELTLRYGEYHPSVLQLKDNIDKMTKELSGEKLPTYEAIGTASVKIVEQASLLNDGAPAGNSKLLIFIIAFVLSIPAGIGLAIVFDFFDQTIKSPQDITTYLDLPVLGSIPQKGPNESPLVKDTLEETKYTVFYEDLTDQLYIFMKTQSLKSILITSIIFRDANNVIVPNLGHCFSHIIQQKTLIIDLSLKNPTVNKILKITNNPGLSQFIENSLNDDANEVNNVIKKVNPDLSVLTAGNCSLNSAFLRENSNLKKIINEITPNYDIVLADCTGSKNINDILMLSDFFDGICLVVNEKKDRRQVLINAIKSLKKNKANIIGGILNNRSFEIPEVIYKRL